MSDAFDPMAFVEDFLTEAAEHLAALDDLMLEAERLTGEGLELEDDLINGLFRSMHTLKGMAGMMGFTATTRLAHALEHVFDEVRRGVRQLAPDHMVVLFEGLDGLKALHARVRETSGEEGLDVDGLLAAIAGLEDAAPGGEGWLGRLDDHDQMEVLVEAAKGAQLYRLTISPCRHCPEGFGAWHAGLGLIGRVCGVWLPDGSAIAPADADARETLQALLLTAADPTSVGDCTGLAAAAIALEPLPWQSPRPAAAPEARDPARKAEPAEAAAPEKATSIRVETTRLDRLMELVGELVIHHTRVQQLSTQLTSLLDTPGGLDGARARLHEVASDMEEAMQSVGRVSDELQESTMKVRMVPVRSLFNRFPRIVRDLARECGKAARLETAGAETELDKTVIEQIGDPLIHLLRNAVDHGLETAEQRRAAGKPAEGVITLAAAQQGHHIVITVSDDGRGIDTARVLAKAREQGLVGEHEALEDPAIWQLIFKPGFSTAAAVTNLSGRGVGMDVVQANIQRLGGSVQVLSQPGAGTRFVIKLPLTLAIAKALLVGAGQDTFAVPLSAVEETLRLLPDEIRTVQGREVIQVRDQVVPIFRLKSLFAIAGEARERRHVPAVIVGNGEERLALVVDALVGQQDVVVKSLGDFLGQPPGVGGATILGDGRVALILDIPTILARQAIAQS